MEIQNSRYIKYDAAGQDSELNLVPDDVTRSGENKTPREAAVYDKPLFLRDGKGEDAESDHQKHSHRFLELLVGKNHVNIQWY